MSTNELKLTAIADIGNYYGGLWVATYAGRFYWCIENYDTDLNDLSYYSEISETTYNALIDENERT